MKKFVYLTYGFTKPSPEIMQKWGAWFEEIKDHIIEQSHLPRGVELSKEGRKELPMDLEAITGMMIIQAESFEQAEKLAESNPYITSIRIYELQTG